VQLQEAVASFVYKSVYADQRRTLLLGAAFVVLQRGGKGCQVDHVCPLACCGLDAPQNMQWLTAEANRAKRDDCPACDLSAGRLRAVD
jgi:hypothetical protein